MNELVFVVGVTSGEGLRGSEGEVGCTAVSWEDFRLVAGWNGASAYLEKRGILILEIRL